MNVKQALGGDCPKQYFLHQNLAAGEISLMTPLSKTVHLHSLVFGVIKLVWDKQAYLCEKDEHNMRFDNLAIS